MKIIIIGGVAAGMSAASRIKRTDKSAEVVVYEKGLHLSYGACGLPYFVSNVNDDWHKMIARTKEEFEAQGITIKLQHEVVKVVPADKKVVVRDLVTGDMFIDNYDKLMIGTGASPIVPNIPGTWLKNVHVLKTIEDGISLKAAASDPSVRDVVVVGGGYIGIEIVEAMSVLGKNVRCIEAACITGLVSTAGASEITLLQYISLSEIPSLSSKVSASTNLILISFQKLEPTRYSIRTTTLETF
jgi:NADPH-dependent 2,4-dienoyl-CoA reductase/sulfur reductase-like enzyme